jgi:hypothetical protein
VAAPTSGVITEAKVQLAAPLPITIPEEVKLLRATGGGNYTVTSQADIQVGSAQTVADVRMPVQAGEFLGMYGLPITYEGETIPGIEFFCETGPASLLGIHPGDVPLGTTAMFTEEPEAAVPLAGVIEPDADHDGYGDETQDKCPQSAAVQTACPVLVVDTYPLPGRKKAVVLVSVSAPTSVSVSGSAKLPKATKSAKTSAKIKLKVLTKSAVPGKLNRFSLSFPGPLKSAIGTLPPGKSITIQLQASATNVTGEKVTDKAKLKIKGR